MRAVLRTLGAMKSTSLALTFLCLLAAGILIVPARFTRAHNEVVKPATATLVVPTPTVADDPLMQPIVPGSWRPLFLESFNGTALDTSHWNTCFWWNANSPLGCDESSANGELERYLPQNVTVHDGALDIVARHERVTTNARSYDYTSGVITTEGKFYFRYGYLAARIRVSPGKGVWPAVWLLAQDHTATNEVDVAEILGDHPRELNTAVHYQISGSDRSVGGVYTAGDFSSDYHVVAIDWEPNSITWYEDGNVAYQVTDPAHIPQKDMYILLSAAVGGYWPGNPDQSTLFPSHFRVDWVQVWSRTDAAHGR